MDRALINEKYRKLSVASLVTGIMAVSFCIIYFLAWLFFDNSLVKVISEYGFISNILFVFVSFGVALTIVSLITGCIDLSRIRAGIYRSRGKDFDITGIILSSLLILFGFILWFVDFFNIVEIIS